MRSGGPLTILGATGYAGRLCAVAAARAGEPMILAARKAAPLERFASRLRTAAGADIEVAVTDATDVDGMTALADRSGVLVTTVGPYTRLGRHAIEAAIAGGSHYVDVAGEWGFLSWVFDQDARAADAGVTVTPACGFDGLVGGLLATVAAQALDGPVGEARTAYLVRGFTPSQGTASSALEMLAAGGASWVDGALVPEPLLARRWLVPFPEPDGLRVGLSVPAPEVLLVPRSTGAANASAYLATPAARLLHPARARAGSLVTAAAAAPSGARLARRVIDRMPEGPSPARRSKARATVLAEAVGRGGTRVAWANLTDPYGTTASAAVAVARRLMAGGADPGVRTAAEVAGDAPGGLLDELVVGWSLL